MGEGKAAPLSEVQEVEGEHHRGRQHAKRGEAMGSDGSESNTVRGVKETVGVCVSKVESKFDALDVEARHELCEHCIDRLILRHEVIRFCREREMLGLSGIRRGDQIGRGGDDARRSDGYNSKSRPGSEKQNLIHRVPAVLDERWHWGFQTG
jgi:hypothetical protein